MPKQQLILLHNLNIKIQKDVFLQTCMSVTFAGQFFTPKKIEQFVLIVHQLPLLLRLSSQRKMLPLFAIVYVWLKIFFFLSLICFRFGFFSILLRSFVVLCFWYLELQAATLSRSSCAEVFCEKGTFKNFAKFTGKHLCKSLLLLSLLYSKRYTLHPNLINRGC